METAAVSLHIVVFILGGRGPLPQNQWKSVASNYSPVCFVWGFFVLGVGIKLK